jgi:hypothetical protein
MAAELLAAYQAGRVAVAIGRASDNFGPRGGGQSNLGEHPDAAGQVWYPPNDPFPRITRSLVDTVYRRRPPAYPATRYPRRGCCSWPAGGTSADQGRPRQSRAGNLRSRHQTDRRQSTHRPAVGFGLIWTSWRPPDTSTPDATNLPPCLHGRADQSRSVAVRRAAALYLELARSRQADHATYFVTRPPGITDPATCAYAPASG